MEGTLVLCVKQRLQVKQECFLCFPDVIFAICFMFVKYPLVKI